MRNGSVGQTEDLHSAFEGAVQARKLGGAGKEGAGQRRRGYRRQTRWVCGVGEGDVWCMRGEAGAKARWVRGAGNAMEAGVGRWLAGVD